MIILMHLTADIQQLVAMQDLLVAVVDKQLGMYVKQLIHRHTVIVSM